MDALAGAGNESAAARLGACPICCFRHRSSCWASPPAGDSAGDRGANVIQGTAWCGEPHYVLETRGSAETANQGTNHQVAREAFCCRLIARHCPTTNKAPDPGGLVGRGSRSPDYLSTPGDFLFRRKAPSQRTMTTRGAPSLSHNGRAMLKPARAPQQV